MGWDGDGDEMGEARGLRRALLHCTALTPFFLSLDRPTSSSDPTQLSHTHNTPFRRLLGSPTLVTHPSQHSCHVPFPTLYFPFCPLFKSHGKSSLSLLNHLRNQYQSPQDIYLPHPAPHGM
jgi:hypothetical protein